MDSSFQSNSNSLPHFGQQQDYESSNSVQALVYCWGRNKDGELSIANNIKFTSTPKPVKGIKNLQIKDLSLGSQHSVLVTEEGKVYACGSALHGKLGIDEGQPTYSKFLQIQGLSDVCQVSVGDYHTMSLLNDGQVYAWGGTLHKKLGQRAGKPAAIASLQSRTVV